MVDPLMCCEEIMWGVEYHGMHPEHYDGISEWRCKQCGKRLGRWTRKELKGTDYEKRFGG